MVLTLLQFFINTADAAVVAFHMAYIAVLDYYNQRHG
jgi:hypothetical protein